MKRILVTIAGLLILAAPMAAQISGTAHNLSAAEGNSEICIFCHTPHNASPAVPLWNHDLSTASYTEYTSPTIDMASVGSLQNGTGVSNLCLSCHDGTVGLGSLVNEGPGGTPSNVGTFITGDGLLGTDLSNDHPVNIIYDITQDTAFNAPVAGKVGVLQLFGAGANELQCASCHDAHDDTFEPFLVMDNASSAMCLTCHIK